MLLGYIMSTMIINFSKCNFLNALWKGKTWGSFNEEITYIKIWNIILKTKLRNSWLLLYPCIAWNVAIKQKRVYYVLGGKKIVSLSLFHNEHNVEFSLNQEIVWMQKITRVPICIVFVVMLNTLWYLRENVTYTQMSSSIYIYCRIIYFNIHD